MRRGFFVGGYMNTVRCYDNNGNGTLISAEELETRVAVYGVFIENGRVLLLRNHNNALWQLPGELLAANERPSHAVRHHLRHIMGILPELGDLLLLEDRFLLDKNGRGLRVSTMYYALRRPTALAATLPEQQEEDLQPEFIEIEGLQQGQLQFGYQAIHAGLTHA